MDMDMVSIVGIGGIDKLSMTISDDSAVDGARIFEALRDICLSCPPFSNEGDEERTTDVAPRLKTR